MGKALRIILIIIAIYFIIVFSLVWLGIIAGVTLSMPFLTNFFPGQEVMTVISMMNLLFVIGIPLIAIILGIIRVVFRRRIGKGWTIGLGLFWLINTVSFVGLGGTLAQEFLVEDQVEELIETETFAADTVHLSLDKVDYTAGPRLQFGPDKIELPGASVNTDIRKSVDASWHLMLHKVSRARNGADARALASEMEVGLKTQAGKLTIPSQVPFSDLRKWRVQEVAVELSVPVGAYVYLSPALLHNGGDIPYDQFPKKEKQLYQMNKAGRLICQDCPAESQQEPMEGQGEADGEGLGEAAIENMGASFGDYSSLDINGPMKVTIEQGDSYDIQFSGNGDFQQQLTTVKDGETLKISLSDAADAPVRVYITLPRLETIKLMNTDDVLIKDFEMENLGIIASGDFELKTDVQIQDFSLEAKNGVEVEMIGTTERLNAKLTDESRLDTDRGIVHGAILMASGGSRIKIDESTEVLKQDISDNSSLKINN